MKKAGWFSFAVSIICLLGSIYLVFETIVFIKSSKLAEATIIDIETRASSGKTPGLVDCPTFRFIAEDGNTYEVKSDYCTNRGDFYINKTIDIYYNPSNPAGARMASFWSLWLGPLVLLFIGIAFAANNFIIIWIKRIIKSAAKKIEV